jgi:hypothetical protein
MNIIIVGDSFSSDDSKGSWIDLLEQKHNVTNLSQRGISEYRIYSIIKKNLSLINQSDILLVWHTNPDRIYIPNLVDYPTRSVSSHLNCDMVAGDVLCDSHWNKIAKIYYKHFFDREMQEDLFTLMIEKIHQIVTCKIFDFSGFNISNDTCSIKSFYELRQNFPGDINHLDLIGNLSVHKYIDQRIKQCEY